MTTSDFEELLDALAPRHPSAIRSFVEADPLHLMAACGQETMPFHVEAMQELLTHRRMLWLAPRGFGKSNVGIFFAAWLAIAHPDHWHPSIDQLLFEGAPERVCPQNIRIALVGASQDSASQLLWSIRALLQRPVLSAAFGSLVGEGRWRERNADTALRDSSRKEPTLSTLGIDSGIAGGHFEVFLADDVYTQGNMRTERGREHTRRIWTDVVLPTLRPYGRMIVLGTRWARDDLAATLIQKQAEGDWDRVLVTPALVEGDDGVRRSIWPEAWPLDRLQKRRAEMGDRPFRAQYLMDPSGIGGGMFDEEMLKRFLDFELLGAAERRGAETCIGIDPALSMGEKADYSAIVAVTKVGDRFFIRECQRGRWSWPEVIRLTQALAKRMGRVRYIIIESTHAQRALVSDFRKVDRDLPVRGQLPERMAGKSKSGRAMAYLKYFEVGDWQPDPRVYFAAPTEANGIARLIEEMSSFPHEAGSDDCVDALIYAMRGFEIQQTRMIKLPPGVRL